MDVNTARNVLSGCVERGSCSFGLEGLQMRYMVLTIISGILVLVMGSFGGYFAFRYISLILALDKVKKEIEEACLDLTQNQMLHLPTPNRHLGKLLCSFNCALEAMRKERMQYEKREKEFQKQIENISHDLRTPLTVILGYLKIFKKSQADLLSDDKELSETVDIIGQKAEVLRHLVSQFYDYSRLNADDYALTPDRVDISRLLRESLMGSFQVLEQAQLAVLPDIPDHPVWVCGDAAALERIFLNLFQNAGRYADTFLQTAVNQQQETVSILFTNDTKMLSKEDIPYLFDRFYTQDSSRSKGGTGLGLTVARSLAEKMDGTLTAYVPQDKDGAPAAYVPQDKDGTPAACVPQGRMEDTKEGITVCFELRLGRM